MANARGRDPLRPYVELVMAERIGDAIGYAGYRTYDDDWNGGECWLYIGYPDELSSGERPAFQGDAEVSSQQGSASTGTPASCSATSTSSRLASPAASAWGW